VFDTFFHFILDLSWLLSIILFLRLSFIAGHLHFNSNKILLFIFLTILFILIKHLAGDYLNYLYGLNVPIGLSFNTPLACSIPILCYLYVKKILAENEDIEYSDFIHLLVFIIFYLILELQAFKVKDIKNIDINSQSAYWEIYLLTKTIPDWLLYFKNILNITYSILSYRLIIKTFGLKSSSKGESFLKKLLNKFTLVKSKSKQVEKTRIWACNITNLKFLLTLISLYFGTIKIMYGQIVSSQGTATLSVSVIILICAIYLNKNKTILFVLPSYTKLNSLKQEKVKEEIKVNEIYEYMLNQIEDKKLYLDEKFRINWLSEELDIKVEHINVILNEYNFKNFSKFSNYLKINKAKELIKEGYLKKYNIDALAGASGFRATNTFYRIFKKEVGYTPKEYSENHNQ
jgi:AraC-like DNA-binding protein